MSMGSCALPFGGQQFDTLPAGSTGDGPHRIWVLLEADDGGGLAPEAFEVVEGALLGAEEVDDHVAEVQQHPTGVRLPLAPAQPSAAYPGGASCSLQRGDAVDHKHPGLRDLIDDRPTLVRIEDEVIALAGPCQCHQLAG